MRASDVVGHSEVLRRGQVLTWLGGDPESCWVPRCEVVVHASDSAYLAAVGAQAKGTSGCSLLQTEQGRVVLRRIDLLGTDAVRAQSALAHELTHVLLADRFVARPLPRWADEGIATLSDNMEKQTGHHRELMTAVGNGTAFRIGELLQTEDYPVAHRIGTFYGQSTCLVRFFRHQRDAASFVRFMEESQRSGYDKALREVYGIAGTAELERQWHRYVLSSQAAPDAEHSARSAKPLAVNVE